MVSLYGLEIVVSFSTCSFVSRDSSVPEDHNHELINSIEKGDLVPEM